MARLGSSLQLLHRRLTLTLINRSPISQPHLPFEFLPTSLTIRRPPQLPPQWLLLYPCQQRRLRHLLLQILQPYRQLNLSNLLSPLQSNRLRLISLFHIILTLPIYRRFLALSPLRRLLLVYPRIPLRGHIHHQARQHLPYFTLVIS
jgi:hypothetical protein